MEQDEIQWTWEMARDFYKSNGSTEELTQEEWEKVAKFFNAPNVLTPIVIGKDVE